MRLPAHLQAAAGSFFADALAAKMQERNLTPRELADAKNDRERLRVAAERAAQLVVQEADTRRWGT